MNPNAEDLLVGQLMMSGANYRDADRVAITICKLADAMIKLPKVEEENFRWFAKARDVGNEALKLFGWQFCYDYKPHISLACCPIDNLDSSKIVNFES